jgi:folate-dependent phosphoribosylglycinamide formyltransferase PurN
MQAIINAIDRRELNAEIALVVSNRTLGLVTPARDPCSLTQMTLC